jgi:hypothetical protein
VRAIGWKRPDVRRRGGTWQNLGSVDSDDRQYLAQPDVAFRSPRVCPVQRSRLVQPWNPCVASGFRAAPVRREGRQTDRSRGLLGGAAGCTFITRRNCDAGGYAYATADSMRSVAGVGPWISATFRPGGTMDRLSRAFAEPVGRSPPPDRRGMLRLVSQHQSESPGIDARPHGRVAKPRLDW